MESLTGNSCRIKPISTWAYFDRVQFWTKHPLVQEEKAHLRAASGYLYCKVGSARFDYRYRCRVELHQPKPASLEWIAMRKDAHVNRVDFALEWCFVNEEEKSAFRKFINTHKARRWHNSDYGIREIEGEAGTVYDAPRGAPSGLVTYKDPISRISGELFVYRIEWRALGMRGVRPCGIFSPDDLLAFDHHAFWKKRLLLYSADEERVGRYYLNCNAAKRRRQLTRHKGRNQFRRAGHILLNGEFTTIQEFIDRYRKAFRITRALDYIDVSEWLPNQDASGRVGLVNNNMCGEGYDSVPHISA